MYLNLIENFNKNLFFFVKKHIFAFLTKKPWIERQLFWKTAKLLPIKLHIYGQKFISVLLKLDQK